MSQVDDYIKKIDILNSQLVGTRNDLALANQRADKYREKYEELKAENQQLREGVIANYRPSFEELVAFARELNLGPEREDCVPEEAQPQDHTDATATDTESYVIPYTERENEILKKLEEKDRQLAEKDARIAEKDRQLAEKDAQYAEMLRQKDLEIEGLRQQIDGQNKEVEDLTREATTQKTAKTIIVKAHFTSDSEVSQRLSNKHPDDRRIEADSFNGAFVESLTDDEKDNLEAAKIERELAKGRTKSRARQEAIQKELEKEDGNTNPPRRNPKQKTDVLLVPDIDYSKSEEEIKEQIRKAVCPKIKPENVEIRLLTKEEMSQEGLRVINRDGNPDYCYFMVIERVPEHYKCTVIQGVRVEDKRKTPKLSASQQESAASEQATTSGPSEASEQATTSGPSTTSEVETDVEDLEDLDEEEKNSNFKTLLAESDAKRTLNCSRFSPMTLAWILDEKYNHGSTFEDIISRMADKGLIVDKVTFNENVHKVIDRLRMGCQTLFLDRIRLGTHEAVDETFMLVAVTTKVERDGKIVEITEYKIRYLWCFYDYLNKIVYYVYEGGSRGQGVLKNTLFSPDCEKANIMLKALISDGYSAYNLFDNPKEGNPFIDANGVPIVLHCGDWVHARRKIVHMIIESQEEALTLINMVRELFVIEACAKNANLLPERIQEMRAKYAVPVINEIFQKAQEYSQDSVLMGRHYTAMAINYLLNQKTRLMNYVKDGNALISSNCVERLMKPVKKILKTCMFIGSENAACNFAMMLSFLATAKKHHLNFYDYMVTLFQGLQSVPVLKKDKDKDKEKKKEKEYAGIIKAMAEPYMPWKVKLS